LTARARFVRRLRVVAFVCFLAGCLGSGVAQAQGLTGSIGLFGDYFPNRHDTAELRARLFAEEKAELSPRVRVTASGFVEGLLSRRPRPGTDGSLHSVNDAIARVQDANIEILGGRVDILAGYARIAWGKLDEIQPTDVINPLDVSRFFFEGRSEARLPMLLARARVHVTDDVTIEGVYLPDFRRGRFDQLDEPTSPFNLPADIAETPIVCLAIGCPLATVTIDDRAPAFTADHAQGGVRLSATTGRIDWSVSAFRGFQPFGLYTVDAAPPTVALTAPVVAVYPRFTMLGGDFETVRGKWGVRGEAAWFTEDSFQSPEVRVVPGRSFDAGVGVDRRAGDYTLSGTVLVHTERYDEPLSRLDSTDGRTDVSLVASVDRTFARERYRFRGFAVYNATEASGFVRGIGMASLRDNLALEGSIGWFAGDGRDLVGRFEDSDFVYVRVKYYF